MKSKKIFTSFIIFILTISLSTFCFADLDPDKFDGKVDTNSLSGAINFSNILGIIQWIAIAVAVAYAIIMGIKFTIGSIDDKAEIKKHLAPFIIGTVIIFGITTFIKAIANFASDI